ncbi:hypothetical protein SCHPADRAFT_943854 [Schizopora paradoxa]|uniref:Uncharacterized protein n=1 Tax=Schizopora paradoxa TaxID=27342 RepID=A0A0H2RCE3_9AGAM|nr:hypothetical protein SCHPADRAFT_943854 [Schizopora paradoxa]
MTSYLNNIALIGSHAEDFQTELKKAGLVPVTFDSADNLLAGLDSYPVVALSGNDHGLDEKNTISVLLDAGKILVAFDPGAKYLSSLHAATRTPIDLTAMKPTLNRPLVIYKKNGDIYVPLNPKVKTGFEVPNGKFQPVKSSNFIINTERNEAKQAKTCDDLDDPANAIEQIKRAINASNENPQDDKAPVSGEVDGLDPGSDVAFYKKIHLSIPYDYHIQRLAYTNGGEDITTSDSNCIQVYHTEWNMTIHVYATNSNPVGQTADTYGGTVYTYVVHDGVHERKSGSPGRSTSSSTGLLGQGWEYYFTDILGYTFRNASASGFLSKTSQQPDENIYDPRDNMFLYNISKQQKMTLFRSNKKQTWEFTADYQKPCAWNRFQMHLDMPNWNDAGYVLSYNDYYNVWDDPGFKESKWYDPGVFEISNGNQVVKKLPDDKLLLSGLSVFSSKIGKVPLHLEFDYIPRAFDISSAFHYKTSAADVIGIYVDDFVLDLTWDE